jgi:hypothetical protein
VGVTEKFGEVSETFGRTEVAASAREGDGPEITLADESVEQAAVGGRGGVVAVGVVGASLGEECRNRSSEVEHDGRVVHENLVEVCGEFGFEESGGQVMAGKGRTSPSIVCRMHGRYLRGVGEGGAEKEKSPGGLFVGTPP